MNNKTYAGIPEEFSKQEQAKIVLIPVSYDGTNSLKGPKNGPEAFLNASVVSAKAARSGAPVKWFQ